MQEFRCPWCGDRPQIEFTYYYEAEAVPGREWLSDDEGQELDRIHLRTNIIGWHVELWQHTLGCRGWLKTVRHNLTHEVHTTSAASESPEVPAP